MKKENWRNKNGITLIALVVTIVVLLLLAGVSISMLTGENGIISQAQEAKKRNREEEIKEKVNLAVMAAKTSGLGKIDIPTLNSELIKIGYQGDGIKSVPTKVTIDGVTVKIQGDSGENLSTGGKIETSGLKIGTKGEDGEITVSNEKYTLQIGDYINYSPTKGTEVKTIKSYDTETGYTTENGYQEFSSDYTGKWRVLGISDEGQIAIVPETYIKTTSNEMYYLKGKEAFTNAIDELDKISAIYSYGYGATGGRSITAEDINKITGYNPNNIGVYDPEQKGQGERYGAGEWYEYGNKSTFYWTGSNYPYYDSITLDGVTGDSDTMSGSHPTSFNWYDKDTKEWKSSPNSTTATSSAKEKITTLESDYYGYQFVSLTGSSSDPNIGLNKESKVYKTLCYDYLDMYWLATTAYELSAYYRFDLATQYAGGISMCTVYFSHDYTGDGSDYGVKPVVYLDPDIELTGSSADGWTIVEN